MCVWPTQIISCKCLLIEMRYRILANQAYVSGCTPIAAKGNRGEEDTLNEEGLKTFHSRIALGKLDTVFVRWHSIYKFKP